MDDKYDEKGFDRKFEVGIGLWMNFGGVFGVLLGLRHYHVEGR
jgi:hypothetical protein